ncbi:MAG: metallophosphoesterase [Candidatus Izemoplasma sp.]
MKIVVFSDAHGDKEAIERIIEWNKDADYYISLGDSALNHNFLLDLDIIAIKGNYPRDPGFVYERRFDIAGKCLFLTHGHKYKVNKGIDKLYYKALEEECDIMLYGHTHVPKSQMVGKVLFINPGAISKPRNGLPPTYVIIEIIDGIIDYEFREVETNKKTNVRY